MNTYLRWMSQTYPSLVGKAVKKFAAVVGMLVDPSIQVSVVAGSGSSGPEGSLAPLHDQDSCKHSDPCNIADWAEELDTETEGFGLDNAKDTVGSIEVAVFVVDLQHNSSGQQRDASDSQPDKTVETWVCIAVVACSCNPATSVEEAA